MKDILHYQVSISTIHGKAWKCHIKTKYIKYPIQQEMTNLNHLMA